MLSYIIIILLILILALLIMQVFRSTGRQETLPVQPPDRRLIENQMRIVQEIHELKKSLVDFQLIFEKESERWRTVTKPYGTSDVHSAEKVNKQNLLLYERYKDIFDLLEEGLTAEEIAQKLNKGYGEVAFILELASQNRT